MPFKNSSYKVIYKKNLKRLNYYKVQINLHSSFGENPFIYSNCNEEMILWEIWLPKYGKIYNALERKNYFDIQKENRREKKKEIDKYSFEQICLF